MSKCREKECWCHDPTAEKQPFCSHCGCSHVTQEYLREYCITKLDMTLEEIGEDDTPPGIILLDWTRHFLTDKEEVRASTLSPIIHL